MGDIQGSGDGVLIPFIDLAAINREVQEDLNAASKRVMRSGNFLLGGELEAFENELSISQGVTHAVGVGSGLDALTLTLRALGVGPGDEVIVPSHTFVATWMAVTLSGATVVPVDVGTDDYNMDVDLMKAAITPRTVAVIPVHLYGRPARMAAISEVARRHGLAVVADGAQSIGATISGKPIAQLAQATTLSFYPAKNLGALGDGGAVLTDDASLAKKVRSLRNYGSKAKYIHDEVGFNSRLDELQAAFLRAKLPYLERWNSRRSQVASAYIEGLANSGLTLPEWRPGTESVWHLFVVRTAKREQLQSHLAADGISTIIHYPVPPHMQRPYMGVVRNELAVAEKLSGEVLSLPMSPTLSTEEVSRVIQSILNLTANVGG